MIPPDRKALMGGDLLRVLLDPARRGRIVALARRDPLLAGPGFLQLPERRLGLEPVDEKRAGLERRLAMRRSGSDEDDALARLQPAIAVDDQARLQGPAPLCLGLDLRELLFRHPRI